MAKWAKLLARMQDPNEVQKAQDMAMSVDSVPINFNPIMVDLLEVCAYCIYYVGDNEESNLTEIVFKNGGVMTVDMPFEKFNNLIQKL